MEGIQPLKGDPMKARKVIVTIEMKSDWKLRDIKRLYDGNVGTEGIDDFIKIHQIHVQVVKQDK